MKPHDTLGRLNYLLFEHDVEITLGHGGIWITWWGGDDQRRSVIGDDVSDAVAKAWWELEGQ